MLRYFLAFTLCGIMSAFAQSPVVLHGPAPVMPSPLYRADPVERWDGVFLGALVGYDWDLSAERTLTPAGVHNWPAPLRINTSNVGGVSASLQLAKNFQSDTIVWGVEVDASYVKHADWRGRYPGPTSGPVFYGGETTDGWIASLRGRLGVSVDQFLLYGFLGPAAGSRAGGRSGTDAYGVLVNSLQPTVGFGYTVGLGAEYRVNERLNLKLEYAYTSLNSRSFQLSNGGFLGTGARYSMESDGRTQAVRLGLNVRLR